MNKPKIYEVDWQAKGAIDKYGYLFDGMTRRYGGQIEYYRIYETKNTAWRKKAACLGIDTEIFFPGQGQDEQTASVKKICSKCEVREECLIDALEVDHAHPVGIRGGFAGRERAQIGIAWRKYLGLPEDKEEAA